MSEASAAGGTWQQVVTEADPSKMKPADVANLGPAPRELTAALNKYVKRMKPSWAPLFVFLALGQVAALIGVIATGQSVGTVATAGLWAAGIVALATWSVKRTKKARDTVRATLRDGELRFARIVEYRQTQTGGRAGRTQLAGRGAYRYDLVFDVDGRRVALRTTDDGVSMINRGQLVEVVYNPAVPDIIVPTFLLV